MAKPNYSYEKRQRELAKKQKKADKERRKSEPQTTGFNAPPPETVSDTPSQAPDANAP